METHLYLSLIPEALILSHLSPAEFGRYTATGAKRQIEGPAVFFEVDPAADLSAFRMDEARARCVPHPDGRRRNSVYVAIYDVLRRVPIDALGRAYLTTPSGITLGLEPGSCPEPEANEAHFFYQELGPVYPRVASRLEPWSFCEWVTSPAQLIALPAIAFIDLKLGGLAYNPPRADRPLPPYQHAEHIRECFEGLGRKPDTPVKIVNRGLRPDILFYLVRSGLYVGGGGAMRYFPLPDEETLESDHHLWWHSAQTMKGY